MSMAAKTTEFICHVLVATTDGSQEPQGFMAHVYGNKNTKIETVTKDIEAQFLKLQSEILD
jgi:hypothetical protein